MEEWITTTASHPGRRRFVAKPLKYMFDYNKSIYEQNVQKRILGIAMAMTTGFADISIYTKFQCFCTMMTGNLIWLGRSLVHGQVRNSLYYSSLIFSYVMGLVAFRVFSTNKESQLSKYYSILSGKWKMRLLPKCAVTIVSIMAVANIFLNTTGMTWLPLTLTAFCFGIINSVGTQYTGSLTFVVTGHITKLTNEIMDYISMPKHEKNNVDKGGMIQNASLVVGFLIGAMIASLNILPAKYEILSIALLYAVSFLWKDRMEIVGAREELTMAVSCDDASVPFDFQVENEKEEKSFVLKP